MILFLTLSNFYPYLSSFQDTSKQLPNPISTKSWSKIVFQIQPPNSPLWPIYAAFPKCMCKTTDTSRKHAFLVSWLVVIMGAEFTIKILKYEFRSSWLWTILRHCVASFSNLCNICLLLNWRYCVTTPWRAFHRISFIFGRILQRKHC